MQLIVNFSLQKWSHFWNDTEDQSYKTVQVNIEHPVKATRLALRSFLRAKKPGVVLHISSIGGQTTRLSVPIYCATKAFINHFVRAFGGLEEAENIKVIAVAPGYVDTRAKYQGNFPLMCCNSMVTTPLWHKENPEKLKSVDEKSDVWIQPSEIAEVMLDLVQSSEYRGGTIIEASGKGQTRLVEVFNDEGPPGIGHSSGANNELEREVFEMLKKEKGN